MEFFNCAGGMEEGSERNEVMDLPDDLSIEVLAKVEVQCALVGALY